MAQERRREARVAMPLFLEEVPYSRMSLPPIVPVEVRPTATLLIVEYILVHSPFVAFCMYF